MSRKVALITGGLRGIGQAITQAFAQDGYDLVVHARSASEQQTEWLKKLADTNQVSYLLVFADFQHQQEISSIFGAIQKKYGRLDVLVNNAGFENCHAAEQMPQEDWNQVLQVNLTAPFQCSQHAAKMMIGNGGGVIINMTSIHDHMPRKGLAHYCSAKAGLHMLTKATALEWAEYGIRVNSIGAGAIETDMNRDAINSFGREKFEKWIPAKRIGNTAEVAQLALYLSSDKASYITGTDTYIDGGYMLNTVRYDDRPNREGDEA